MITYEFNFVCDGESCTQTFSDGYNRLPEEVRAAWLEARRAGWRDVGETLKPKHLCPKCHEKWLSKRVIRIPHHGQQTEA